MIRIEAVWLAVQPVDLRAGGERLMAQVVQVFGAARSHHGYLFANARRSRMKLLVHVLHLSNGCRCRGACAP